MLQVVHNCSGADPGFKVRGAHLKKMRRAEGGANIFWVFRVKNHDFTPKKFIFSNCGGRREHFGGISCDKSQFCAKKSYFFPILGGARAGCAPPPPLDPPLLLYHGHMVHMYHTVVDPAYLGGVTGEERAALVTFQ